MRGAQHRPPDGGEILDLGGTALARSTAETAVLGQKLGGDAHGGGVSQEDHLGSRAADVYRRLASMDDQPPCMTSQRGCLDETASHCAPSWSLVRGLRVTMDSPSSESERIPPATHYREDACSLVPAVVAVLAWVERDEPVDTAETVAVACCPG